MTRVEDAIVRIGEGHRHGQQVETIDLQAAIDRRDVRIEISSGRSGRSSSGWRPKTDRRAEIN